MQMPVIVGVILAIMFLVTFSSWFYNFAKGLNALVLDDIFYTYRIIAASVLTIIVMVGSFYVISLINECPRQERAGFFAGLRCESYLKLKASTDLLFQPKDQPVNEAL